MGGVQLGIPPPAGKVTNIPGKELAETSVLISVTAMNRRDFLIKSSAAVSLGLVAKGPLMAQGASAPPGPAQPPPPVTAFHPLRRNTGYFTGRGGTIGWLADADALVAVDTQFPDTAAIFLEKMPGRNSRGLDAVINTHHHFDHTAGNATFRPVTKTIVAQANVPELMRAAVRRNPNPLHGNLADFLPDTTFADAWRHDFGDETIAARYFGPAHTSGDSAILLEKANVVHVGDLLFNRIYPVIDRGAGGRFKGWIARLDELVNTYPADAIYICGHGHQKFGVTGGHADLLYFRDYLSALLTHVEKEIRAGKTREEIVKLENFPGFPDLHVPPGPGNRLGGNLVAAYDELTGV